MAGAADRILVSVGIPYESQVWFFRIAALVAPVVVGALTLRICRELQASDQHPLGGVRVRRRPIDTAEDG